MGGSTECHLSDHLTLRHLGLSISACTMSIETRRRGLPGRLVDALLLCVSVVCLKGPAFVCVCVCVSLSLMRRCT